MLVFILAVTQAAIRRGREGLEVEQALTMAELRAAMRAIQEIETQLGSADRALHARLRERAPEDSSAGDTSPADTSAGDTTPTATTGEGDKEPGPIRSVRT